jgi:opacity protein-like surface antigen
MRTYKKIALTAALILGAASAALANDVDTNVSEAQSAREWAAYLGQTHGHMREHVLVSNTYDSSDWAPVYAGPTMRHEPKVGAREKSADGYVRLPSWQSFSTTDRPR